MRARTNGCEPARESVTHYASRENLRSSKLTAVGILVGAPIIGLGTAYIY